MKTIQLLICITSIVIITIVMLLFTSCITPIVYPDPTEVIIIDEPIMRGAGEYGR